MTSPNLSGLIERLRAATSGSRELDRMIAGEPEGTTRWSFVPAYTTDLSAIVALVEKKFGNRWCIDASALERPEAHVNGWIENGATPCLAACIALLLALQSEVSHV